jgi:uncharacterized membrane protein
MIAHRENAVQASRESSGSRKLFILFLAGFFTVLAGLLVLIIATVLYGSRSVNFGGVILIGPIPIVVGIGSDPIWTVLLAVILTVLSAILFLVPHRKTYAETEKAS